MGKLQVKLAELQQKLNERKHKARTKKHQKLGREFYQLSQVKTFVNAHQMLANVPIFQQSTQKSNLMDIQMQQLITLLTTCTGTKTFGRLKISKTFPNS